MYPDVTSEIAETAKSYQYQDPPDVLVFLQDLIASTLRWLRDFLQSFHINIPFLADSRAISGIMQLLIYIAGATAILILVSIVWSRLSYLSGQSKLAIKGQTSSQALLDSSGWQQEAAQMAERQEWRAACRALYLASLRALHEKDIASFAPARTNYEYWYFLAPYPQLQLAFRRLAERVERIWFGKREGTQSDYTECREDLDQVLNLAESYLPEKQVSP